MEKFFLPVPINSNIVPTPSPTTESAMQLPHCCDQDEPQEAANAATEQQEDFSEDYESSEYDDEDMMDEDEAKQIICHFVHNTWRPCSSKLLASMFLMHGPPSLEVCRTKSYNEIIAINTTPRVMRVTDNLLQRCINYMNWNRCDNKRVTGRVHIKIFFAAYLITFRPENVFGVVDSLSDAVAAAALPMLESFYRAAAHMAAGTMWQDFPPEEDSFDNHLPNLFGNYIRTFKAWKTQVFFHHPLSLSATH